MVGTHEFKIGSGELLKYDIIQSVERRNMSCERNRRVDQAFFSRTLKASDRGHLFNQISLYCKTAAITDALNQHSAFPPTFSVQRASNRSERVRLVLILILVLFYQRSFVPNCLQRENLSMNEFD